ncbi:response regulator [Autumnicola psychrophila]|uniref:Response regulator n=1 Tax=Autumnicola psychrophila TaxID=3075592 RepID=A0ABU3DMJ5_9FLAO|nr:response regulator [Zunongwangia sp. F225]MDT0684930.1 response regulator [Zunongwangia sp. F225]
MKKINLACIVDDDPIQVFLCENYLKMSGLIENIMILRDGKEAYEKFKAIFLSGQSLPEVVLLDLNMPIWDGWQFLDEFTTIPVDKKITIFILTSSIDKRDMERAKKYKEVSNYIVKPVTMKTLKRLLEEVVN